MEGGTALATEGQDEHADMAHAMEKNAEIVQKILERDEIKFNIISTILQVVFLVLLAMRLEDDSSDPMSYWVVFLPAWIYVGLVGFGCFLDIQRSKKIMAESGIDMEMFASAEIGKMTILFLILSCVFLDPTILIALLPPKDQRTVLLSQTLSVRGHSKWVSQIFFIYMAIMVAGVKYPRIIIHFLESHFFAPLL